jgi:hypothetical protein
MKWQVSPKFCTTATIIAFVIAVMSFFGVILEDDMVGRLIFGITWFLIGILWLGQYFQAKKEIND